MCKLIPLFGALLLAGCLPHPTGATQAPTAVLLAREHDGISTAEYQDRRRRLTETLSDAPLLFIGNVERTWANDIQYPFRQESDFLYLSGHREPGAMMILSATPFLVKGQQVKEVLFLPPTTDRDQIWTGKRVQPAQAQEQLGFAASLPTERFESFVASFIREHEAIYLHTPTYHTSTFAGHTPATYYEAYAEALTTKLEVVIKPPERLDAALLEMRLVKSDHELQLIQRAVDISIAGHQEAMRRAGALQTEYQFQAVLEYAFASQGAEAVSSPPIVGSGANATVLLYRRNRDAVRRGDLICIDAAAAYRGYAADITRTFPLDGTFTDGQRALYEIVLEAQKAGEKHLVSGANYGEVGEAISDVLYRGLQRLGIVRNRHQYGQVYLHGWGHHVGVDIHDAGIRAATLKEGMVMTIEPGLYISSERIDFEVDPRYLDIGIRVEDMYVITQAGNRRLSSALPREADAIERFMKQ